MASVAKRPDGRWRARYRDSAGKEHAKHFTRKVDAQEWLDTVTTARRTGTYADPRLGKTRVTAIADAWIAANIGWKESTAARNCSIVDTYIRPTWGHLEVSAVDQADVQGWVASLAQRGLSPRTVRKVYFVLNGIMKYAVFPLRSIAITPCLDVKLPAARTVQRRYLDASQVEALAAAAGDSACIVFTLAYTGLRWGELAALRVKNVDILRGRLIIEESVTEVNGRLVWSTPKDHQRRTVPLPTFLRGMIEERLVARAEEDILFSSPRGGVLRVRAARRSWFDAAATAAGLSGLNPSELRHTAASLAVHAGAHVLAVQRMLGHEKASMTLDVYADLFDGDLDLVAEQLDAVRAKGSADHVRTTAFGRGLAVV